MNDDHMVHFVVDWGVEIYGAWFQFLIQLAIVHVFSVPLDNNNCIL